MKSALKHAYEQNLREKEEGRERKRHERELDGKKFCKTLNNGKEFNMRKSKSKRLNKTNL